MQTPKFSVVLIARNESKTLPRLVASLKEFQERGGEIILLNTGSTDSTAETARNLGCKVEEVGDRFKIEISADKAKDINEKFIVAGEDPIVKAGDTMFDYSSARNYAATLSSNDVIATPDCDEIFTKFDIDKINEAIIAGVDQLEYNFVFSHDENGAELIKFLHCKFYNKKKMWWTGIIHEVLTTKENVIKSFFDESIIKLEHFQNVETNRSHYLKGLAYDCFNNPDNDRNAHYLGRELLYTYRPLSAIKQLQNHIAMNRWPTEAGQSLIFIGDANMAIGCDEQALASYLKAFDYDTSRREPLMKIAEYYYKKGLVDQTIVYTAAALQVTGTSFYANYQPYYENIPHEMLYWALWKKGEIENSRTHFDICLAYQPFNPKYLYDFRHYYNLPKISFIIPTLDRPEGLKKCVNSIKALNYPQEKIDIILVPDKSDSRTSEDISCSLSQFKVCYVDDKTTVPNKVKFGLEMANGDWIVYASNDIEFEPDSIMCAFKQAMDNSKYFVAFNTGSVGYDEGNICEHFMIHRKLISKIGGEIFDTEFTHVGIDNLLWAKMKKLGHAMRCNRAKVKHNHFAREGGKMDEVYSYAYRNCEADRKLLEKKLLELNSPEENGNFTG